jgi:predicted metalloprotease with PDZ domain
MGPLHRRNVLLVAVVFLFSAVRAFSQSAPTISLTVDATQAPLKIIRTHIEMQANPGALTFYYPKWIPGMHEPSGPIANVTGLKFSVDGKTIPWQRDLLDVFTFHVDIPLGAKQLEASFDFLESGGLGGGSATDKLVVINWSQNLLYPAGTPMQQIVCKTKLLLPPGWKFGTALPIVSQSRNEVTFQPASLERLVDSPLVAGEYYRAIDLTPPGEPIHHEIDMVADGGEGLAMSPEVQRGLTNLVAETGKLFGTRHYREYHFLLTLSDHTGHFGIEHHESNDSRLAERTLLLPAAAREVGSLLAHEFAHSWCGKFRRPKDQVTPDFEAPLEDDLLWVYEGNTSYFGNLLAARSGLWTPEDYRGYIEGIAASLGPGTPGRTWRPLLDTAVAIPGMFRGGTWNNWRRGSDYYPEGDLLWLEVATTIHDQSHGQKSFEDFCRLFFGGPNNGPEVKPYTLEDLVHTLGEVVPYDWATFFHERLTSTSAEPPMGGVNASGWKLVFEDQPPSSGSRRSYSMGLSIGPDGEVLDSTYDGPAFKAGITPGMKIVGVNGRIFTTDLLDDAIKASKSGPQGIELLVVNDDYYKTCVIDYHGGERYPHLVRDPSKPDYLNEILKPLARQQ